MNIKDIPDLITLILSISIASERLVTIIKTLFPTWLADEKKTEAQEVDLLADKWRRFAVLLIAFAASWVITTVLAENHDPFGIIKVGGGSVNACILGLLASGGSAFWNNMLGYTKAIKDINVQRKAKEGLDYHEQAKSAGLTAIDSGQAASSKIGSVNSMAFQNSVNKLYSLSQPESIENVTFLLNNPRI